MPAWMKTPDWDDHRYALPAQEPPRRVRLFFQLVDGFCAVARWVRS